MSSGRTLAVAGLEFRTLAKGPLFWCLVLATTLATLAINPAGMIPNGDPGGLQPFMNSRYAVAQLFCLTGFLVYSFFAAIMAGMSIIRDDEAEISELLHSTPLAAREYILGKFAGVMAALAGVLVLHVLVAMVCLELRPVTDAATQRGPFRLASYFLPVLAFAGPAIWASAGIAFAVGERTRKPLLVYAVPTALFAATVFIFLPSRGADLDPWLDNLLLILDPSGLGWLIESFFLVDRGAEFYNTAPLAFDWIYFTRLGLALVLPMLAVLGSIGHCGRVARGKAGGFDFSRWRRPAVRQGVRPASLATESSSFRPLRDLQMTTSKPGFLASTWHILRAELAELRGQPSIYVFITLVLLMIPEGGLNRHGVYGASLLLTAGTMARATLSLIGLLVCLLLLFFTVESLQREKITGFGSIFYALPFRTSALLLAKGLAGAVIVSVTLAGSVALCLALLALQEGTRFEVWPFVVVWCGVLPATFFVWTSFIVAVYAGLRQRYLTYAVGLAALAVTFGYFQRGKLTWVTNWPLWGTLRWSDMGTFDLNGRALLLNRSLALVVGVFCVAVAIQFFARTEPDATAAAWRRRPGKVLHRALRLAPFALLPLLLGGYLNQQIGVGFQGAVAQQTAKNYWRRNLATWFDFETAKITHVDLAVELWPARRGATIAGTFTMVNQSEQPMRWFPFTVAPSFGEVSWTLDGRSAAAENRSGLALLERPTSLAPGGQVVVGFAYDAVYPQGMTRNGRGVEQFVLPAGVVLHTLRDSFLPTPGFVESIGVGEDNRYAPRALPADLRQREEAQPASGDGVPFTTRIEVTAPSVYTVNSVGNKTAEYTDHGRTTVVWESDYPIGAVNILAGRWQSRQQGGAAVYFHPDHQGNIDQILGTLAAARRYYSEWFFPYPWQQLRLSEFPNLVTNAQGFPTNISFSEGIGFLERPQLEGAPFSMVAAHEAAHQWWGNLVAAAEGPGTAHLVEGMAHFSALLLQEAQNGLRGRLELSRKMEASYGRKRRLDGERPVAEMVDDRETSDWTVVYEKGAWVMWMLHNHLGPAKSLAGLSEFVRQFHHHPKPPVTADLLTVLRSQAVDPEAFDAFVEQWFYDVVLPIYRWREVSVRRVGERFEIKATIENIGTGTATVEVSAVRGQRFADRAPGGDSPYQDQRTSVLLGGGQSRQVSWTVDFDPERLVIDPDLLILQLDRDLAVAEL